MYVLIGKHLLEEVTIKYQLACLQRSRYICPPEDLEDYVLSRSWKNIAKRGKKSMVTQNCNLKYARVSNPGCAHRWSAGFRSCTSTEDQACVSHCGDNRKLLALYFVRITSLQFVRDYAIVDPYGPSDI